MGTWGEHGRGALQVGRQVRHAGGAAHCQQVRIMHGGARAVTAASNACRRKASNYPLRHTEGASVQQAKAQCCPHLRAPQLGGLVDGGRQVAVPRDARHLCDKMVEGRGPQGSCSAQLHWKEAPFQQPCGTSVWQAPSLLHAT